MEIPSLIKRKYIDIDKLLDVALPQSFIKNESKEYFINRTCNDLSVWFKMNHAYNSDLSPKEINSCFMYMFRTKLTLFWEKTN